DRREDFLVTYMYVSTNTIRRYQHGKSTIAALFSLIIPGLGQFYAGHMLRGIGIFIVAVIVGIFSGLAGSPIIAVLAAIDAYFLASKAD
ncbi:MAG: hypothetical protein P1P80_10320, partial [ANME-2 cluster archaeon]|nr:hypothetical protein [ANME-2 cluster archaeon]